MCSRKTRHPCLVDAKVLDLPECIEHPVIGKDIVINGDTYIYNGNLYLTGDINKRTFNSSTGTWTQQKSLNDYFVMKGVKTTHCLDK
jgi:hypothetical protein